MRTLPSPGAAVLTWAGRRKIAEGRRYRTHPRAAAVGRLDAPGQMTATPAAVA